MALYWRVRKWKYNISGNYAGPLSLIGAGEFTPEFTPANEESLVCGAPYLFGNGDVVIVGGDVPYSFTFEMYLFSLGFTNQTFLLNGESCSTYFQIVAEQGGYSELQSFQSSEELRIAGNYYIRLFGLIISSGILYSGFPDYYLSPPGSCSLIIEPSEYWSYGRTYDTTTGEPL
jgi:hypothetical protein